MSETDAEPEGPRQDDPRVIRTRAAVLEAARTLFLRNGYAGTSMDDIATLAGVTKRTVYNNFSDKDALFRQIVAEIVAHAEKFANTLREEFGNGITAADLGENLRDLARRLALGIMRPEVIALRRLLIGEARTFPALARDYYDRAPAQVIGALSSRFAQFECMGLLRLRDARMAAAQFAYLIVGESLDHAMLEGAIPSNEHVILCADEGVETFLARYGNAAPIPDDEKT